MLVFRMILFIWLILSIGRMLRLFLGGNPPMGRGPRRNPFDIPPPPGGQHRGNPFRVSYHAWEPPPPPPPPPPRQAAPAEKTAYDILGISTHASMQEIRAAYQTLIRQYHPDLTGNLAPELRDLAEKRTKEITAAYNQLKRR